MWAPVTGFMRQEPSSALAVTEAQVQMSELRLAWATKQCRQVAFLVQAGVWWERSWPEVLKLNRWGVLQPLLLKRTEPPNTKLTDLCHKSPILAKQIFTVGTVNVVSAT